MSISADPLFNHYHPPSTTEPHRKNATPANSAAPALRLLAVASPVNGEAEGVAVAAVNEGTDPEVEVGAVPEEPVDVAVPVEFDPGWRRVKLAQVSLALVPLCTTRDLSPKKAALPGMLDTYLSRYLNLNESVWLLCWSHTAEVLPRNDDEKNKGKTDCALKPVPLILPCLPARSPT